MGSIAEYHESVNGGIAMAQLGVAPERMAKVMRRWADRFLATDRKCPPIAKFQKMMRGVARRGILIAAFLLSACVGARPDDAMMCPADSIAPAYGASMASDHARQMEERTRPDRASMSTFSFSPAAAHGAHTARASSTAGRSAKPALGNPRPQFDVVTGVSTGAIIAHIRVARPRLRFSACRSLSRRASSDLFRRRSIFEPAVLEFVQRSEALEAA